MVTTMRLNAAWTKGSLLHGSDLANMAFGFVTDEHPKAGPGKAVLVTSHDQYVVPISTSDVDVYLEHGLTEPIRDVLIAAINAGYKIVPRDARQWPAPRMNIHMRIAPGTE